MKMKCFMLNSISCGTMRVLKYSYNLFLWWTFNQNCFKVYLFIFYVIVRSFILYTWFVCIYLGHFEYVYYYSSMQIKSIFPYIVWDTKNGIYLAIQKSKCVVFLTHCLTSNYENADCFLNSNYKKATINIFDYFGIIVTK